MIPPPTHIEQLTETIIGCAIEVHKNLGAGLLESVFRECMIVEMRQAQLCFEQERTIRLTYKGVPINSSLRLDLIVEGLVVVELKAIECIHPVHLSQVITYLKLTNCPAGPDLYKRKSNEQEEHL